MGRAAGGGGSGGAGDRERWRGSVRGLAAGDGQASRTAPTAARMWVGVVPQQPPTSDTPASANRRM